MVSAAASGGAVRPETQGSPKGVSFDPSEAAAAVREMDQVRAGWVRFYARELARFGALYHVVVIGITIARRPTWHDAAVFGLWIGLVALLAARASTHALGRYIVASFTICSLLSLQAQGFLGATGALICTLPLCAAVFTGLQGAALSGLAILSAYALFAYGYHSGLVDASAHVLRVTDPAAWIWVTAAFLALTASAVALLGKVVDDLDGAARRFSLVKERLGDEARSRARAECARDAVLGARERSRDIEALGLVAGSALHDINNMAMVLGSWAELLEMEADLPDEAAQAAQNIRAACRRLGTLGRDVLGLGRGQSSTMLRLSEALPAAADVLRRALPEDVYLRMSLEEPLPEIAMQRADLVHVLLEAVASLTPRSREGSALVVSAMAPHGEYGGSVPPLVELTVRHIAAPPSEPPGAVAENEEELLTTDDVRIVQRRRDSDAVELALYPTPSTEPS